MKKHILFFMIIAVSFGFIQAQSITVNIPNSATIWNVGGTYDITWTAVGSMDANVKIRLMNGHGGLEDLILAIVESTPNTGTYSWTIPASITPGDYLIRVKTVDNAVGDDGDFFRIVASPGPASITVNSPGNGIVWQAGGTYDITWTPVGSMNANVKIRLMKGFGPDDLILPITESTLTSAGTFSWTIPTTVFPRPYLIRVKTVDNAVTGNGSVFQIAAEITPPVVRRPDLVVSELTYTMRNKPPRSCDTITLVRVRAKIKNIGAIGCNRISHARLTIAGPEPFQKIEKTFLISKLPQNGSDSISWEYKPFTYGIYKHEVEVDIGNSLTEASESNNKKKKLLGVNPLPDLVVCVSCGKRPPVGGKRDVHAWIKNIGQFDAVNFRLRFYIKQKGTTHHTISRLKPGKMVKITRRHRWGLSGSKNITATVDCDGSVREMSETNNFVKAKYFVRLPHHDTYAMAKNSCLEGFFKTETSINESHCCSYTPYQATSTAKLKVKIK